MSLQYDSTKCTPSLPTDKNDSCLRECLIFASMLTGIGTITDKNQEEVYARIHTLELMNGAYQVGTDENGIQSPVYITRENVARWIGLSTNASPMTRAQFLKVVSRRMDEFVKGRD